MNNSEKFKSYLLSYQNKDIEAVSKLFAPDIHLRDWKISVHGKAIAISETQKNFNNASSLEIETLNIMENENSVSGELKIIVNQTEVLYVVDVLTFNNAGLISSIRAYLGREN
ncbi:nuclear transport factor 2 family protein [Alteromonas abrolhosensis]|uniref:nuclear transport factor 2 family protein n=1 Tax=Alteromonas abrolhosensis TaxID=1892904 RepID=UPI003BAA5029